jgi:PHD/YefM family antitoxin component YafN of YafNO toxin-antitoxin module
MNKFNYTEAQNDAYELISEFGANALAVVATSEYEPVAGATSEIEFSMVELKAVNLPINSSLGLSGDKQFQEDLKLGRIKGFYTTSKDSNFNPEPGSFLIWQGKLWDVVAATPLAPANINVLFTIGCKESSKHVVADILTALEVDLTFFDS